MPFRTAESEMETKARANAKSTHKKIWIDLDNSPHIPFFRPIIEKLRDNDYEVLVTARDAYGSRTC